MVRAWRGAVAALVLLSAGAFSAVHSLASSSDAPDPASLPVIMVHGYSPAQCPAFDSTHSVWGGLYVELDDAGWSGPLLPVTFYRCDTDGVDITGYGATPPGGATPTVTAASPRVPYTQATSIGQLAHDLAWFTYDTYSAAGTAVDLVGSSMGGLVMRDALARVAAGDPAFPPYLLVSQAVTISTPNAGYGTPSTAPDLCGATTECDQMAAGSSFMADLETHADPQGRDGTAWTVVGSSAGCDLVPAASALAMPGAEQVDFRAPCYEHEGYLWDFGTDADATATITPPGREPVRVTAAPRSLVWLAQRLRSPGADPDLSLPSVGPEPSPTPSSAPPSTSAPPSAEPTPTPTRGSSQSDTAEPSVAIGSLAEFRASRTIRLTYSGSDTGSGIAGYDVRDREAAWSTGFGPWGSAPSWLARSSTSLAVSGRPGHEYCFEVRARDRAGNTSAWSRETCTVIALDDRSLAATSRGWHRGSTSLAYLGSQSSTARRGATLTLRRARAERIALVVVECPRCGSIGVYLNGRLWHTVTTRSAKTRREVVVIEPRFSVRTTNVTLQSRTTRPVYIDGLAVEA
jgi:hypothetical protein